MAGTSQRNLLVSDSIVSWLLIRFTVVPDLISWFLTKFRWCLIRGFGPGPLQGEASGVPVGHGDGANKADRAPSRRSEQS